MAQIYLDSCLVIYLVQAPAPVRLALRKTLLEEKPTVFISALTPLECRVWPLRQNASKLLAEFDRFLNSRDLRRARMTLAVFDKATELRARFNVKTPDALHLAAAIEAGCDEFWTNDLRIPRDLEGWIKIRALSQGG